MIEHLRQVLRDNLGNLRRTGECFAAILDSNGAHSFAVVNDQEARWFVLGNRFLKILFDWQVFIICEAHNDNIWIGIEMVYAVLEDLALVAFS